MGGEGGGTGGSGGGPLPSDPCGAGDLSAEPDVLVDIGYTGGVTSTISGDRILANGILWNSETRTQMREVGLASVLAGDRVIAEGGLYDAVTGALITSFTAGLPNGISEAGGYAYYSDGSGIHVVDAMGTPILDWPGAYISSTVVALPGELLIAGGPAGANVVEHVTLAGAQTLTPFTGSFKAFFRDGQRFITAVGSNVRVYTNTGVQEHLWLVPDVSNMDGMGDFFWAKANNSYRLYQVGVLNSGVVYNANGVRKTQLGLSYVSGTTLNIVVPGVSTTTYTIPPMMNSGDADELGNWVVSNQNGVVTRHGTPADPADEGLLGCGKVTGLAGSMSGHAAVATASDQVLIYDVTATDRTLTHVLPADLRYDMELTEDGTKLLGATGTSTATQLWDIPNETLLPSSVTGRFDYADVGGTVSTATGVGTETNPTAYWSGSVGVDRMPCVSPAAGGDFTVPSGADQASCLTTFFVAGVPVNTAAGCAMGWLSDDRVLMQSYSCMSAFNCTLQSASIYDRFGNFVSASPFSIFFLAVGGAPFCVMQPAVADTVFVTTEGRVVDVSSGADVLDVSIPGELPTRVGGYVMHTSVVGKVMLTAY